jgi:intracellular septation protein
VDIPSIFILRDTIFDTIFGIALLISVYKKKPLLKVLFKNVFAMTECGWSELSLRWGFYYLLAAGINEWIRLTRSPDDWVHLKVVLIIITTLFGFYQFRLIRRERLPDSTPWGLVR